MGLDSGNYWICEKADIDAIYRYAEKENLMDAGPIRGGFLTVTTLKDPSKMKDGVHTMEAFTFVSYDAFKPWLGTKTEERSEEYEEFKRDLTERMLDMIDPLIPGLRDHMLLCELGTPLTNEYYVSSHRGNLYGFVSFSDHGSTHNSWAGVWAEEPTRAALFSALLARRTFGASDEMVVKMTAGAHVMGEQFEARKPITLSLDITAPQKLLRVDLIKNGRVVWSKRPDGRVLSETFHEADVSPGRSYYYVRVLQYDPDPPRITYPDKPGLKDPEMAWGSPVFVTYR